MEQKQGSIIETLHEKFDEGVEAVKEMASDVVEAVGDGIEKVKEMITGKDEEEATEVAPVSDEEIEKELEADKTTLTE